MSYQPMAEKAPVIPAQQTDSSGRIQSAPTSDVRRARLALLILLVIQLVVAAVTFIQSLISLIRFYSNNVADRSGKTGTSFIVDFVGDSISLIYVIIFLIVVVKYVRVGILIFAWLGLIKLILNAIAIVFLIIAIVAAGATSGVAAVGIGVAIFLVILVAISCILTIVTVIFAFKLAKLLKMHGAYQFV